MITDAEDLLWLLHPPQIWIYFSTQNRVIKLMLFFLIYLFNVYKCFASLHVCSCTMCVECLLRTEVDVGSAGTGVTDDCDHLFMLEIKPGSSARTGEPTLQPLNQYSSLECLSFTWCFTQRSRKEKTDKQTKQKNKNTLFQMR